MSTSHDWAKELHKAADYLLSRPEVNIGSTIPKTSIYLYGDKAAFLACVRATIPGKKEIGDYSVSFQPKHAPLDFRINRDAVCRKVQDVKYECEPLLSPEEDMEMDASLIPIDAPLAQAIQHDQQLEREGDKDASADDHI